ncbi:50S ribosomal protein L10 [Planctomycetales bacterium]|nr:50S ribosomal protein L10 [Planctomycetales bacterium]
MSKFVKQLIIDGVSKRLENVQYLLLVSLSRLDANTNKNLRALLASKNINLLAIKNSLAGRATEGTPLGPLFKNLAGSFAVCWGGTDIVALAKEIVKLTKDRALEGFEIKGAVLDGEAMNAAQAVEISKWLSREEQISVIIGQAVGIGAKLASQLNATGGALASQIVKISEKETASAETVAEEAAPAA